MIAKLNSEQRNTLEGKKSLKTPEIHPTTIYHYLQQTTKMPNKRSLGLCK